MYKPSTRPLLKSTTVATASNATFSISSATLSELSTIRIIASLIALPVATQGSVSSAKAFRISLGVSFTIALS